MFKTTWAAGDSGHAAAHNALGAALNGALFARSYGVKADGSTNDSPALQAAVNAAVNQRVILPPGTIRLVTPVTIPSTCAGLVGAGWTSTVLLPSTGALHVGGTYVGGLFADFQIQGGTVGILIDGSGAFLETAFERVDCLNQTEAGLRSLVEFDLCRFTNCRFCGSYNGSTGVLPAYGIHHAGACAKYQNVYRDCRFTNCQTGVYLENTATNSASETYFEYCQFALNWRYGLRVTRAFGLNLIGGYFEANSREAQGFADVKFEGAYPSTHVRFTDCQHSYDLGRAQPQLCFDADAGSLENILLENCKAGGFVANAGGARVVIIGRTGWQGRADPLIVAVPELDVQGASQVVTV